MQENSKKHIYSSDNKRQLQDSRIPSNISLVISILLSVVRNDGFTGTERIVYYLWSVVHRYVTDKSRGVGLRSYFGTM